MKYFFIVVFLLLLFMFSSVFKREQSRLPNSEKVTNALLYEAAILLKKKYDIRPIGTNVAMPGGVIKLLGLDFQVFRKLSKETARDLLIKSGTEFLSMINNDQDIRPYLKKYPMSIEDIDITLFMRSPERYEVYDPDICVASFSYGKLRYKTQIPQKNGEAIKNRTEESYEEALKAMKEEHLKLH